MLARPILIIGDAACMRNVTQRDCKQTERWPFCEFFLSGWPFLGSVQPSTKTAGGIESARWRPAGLVKYRLENWPCSQRERERESAARALMTCVVWWFWFISLCREESGAHRLKESVVDTQTWRAAKASQTKVCASHQKEGCRLSEVSSSCPPFYVGSKACSIPDLTFPATTDTICERESNCQLRNAANFTPFIKRRCCCGVVKCRRLCPELTLSLAAEQDEDDDAQPCVCQTTAAARVPTPADEEEDGATRCVHSRPRNANDEGVLAAEALDAGARARRLWCVWRSLGVGERGTLTDSCVSWWWQCSVAIAGGG